MSSYMVEIVEKSNPPTTLGFLVSDFDEAKAMYDHSVTNFDELLSVKILELTGDPDQAKILFEKSEETNE